MTSPLNKAEITNDSPGVTDSVGRVDSTDDAETESVVP